MKLFVCITEITECIFLNAFIPSGLPFVQYQIHESELIFTLDLIYFDWCFQKENYNNLRKLKQKLHRRKTLIFDWVKQQKSINITNYILQIQPILHFSCTCICFDRKQRRSTRSRRAIWYRLQKFWISTPGPYHLVFRWETNRRWYRVGKLHFFNFIFLCTSNIIVRHGRTLSLSLHI